MTYDEMMSLTEEQLEAQVRKSTESLIFIPHQPVLQNDLVGVKKRLRVTFIPLFLDPENMLLVTMLGEKQLQTTNKCLNDKNQESAPGQ